MKKIVARLSSLICLTRQERTVIIFLVVSLLIGNSILFVKRRRQNFATDLVTFNELTLDELIIKSDSLLEGGKKYLKIDVNTATLQELQLLPGVGQATARNIIDCRDRLGRFRVPEDLLKVKGIGEAKYGTIKDCIVVRPANQAP